MNESRIQELNEIVRKSYDLTADHFNATRSKMAAADFLWAAERINSDDRVLDAGCGNARLLDYIELKADNYIGVDISEKLIEIAQAKYIANNFQNIRLQDITKIRENNFTKIFCSASIIHIPSRKERIGLLKDFYEISTNDAKLIISAWKMTGKGYLKLKSKSIIKALLRFQINSWRDLVFPWLDQDANTVVLRYYHLFSQTELRKELLTAGWYVDEVLNDRHNFWFIAKK